LRRSSECSTPATHACTNRHNSARTRPHYFERRDDSFSDTTHLEFFIHLFFSLNSPFHSKHNQEKEDKKKEKAAQEIVRNLPQVPSHMFFKFNSALGPPYHVLLDTNFINFAIQNKLDIMQSAMTCLLAKCHIYITDCVMAELEKLGQQYRVALRYRDLTLIVYSMELSI
jgi:hypothetical protein